MTKREHQLSLLLPISASSTRRLHDAPTVLRKKEDQSEKRHEAIRASLRSKGLTKASR